jgi:hypothetical protein
MAHQKKNPAVTGVQPAKPVKTGVDLVIEKLKQKRCRFPVSRAELLDKYQGIAGEPTVRELARRGLLVDSELWDGSLPRFQASVLEGYGVTNRAGFRQRYLAGQLDISRWRCFGHYKRQQLLTWAGLPLPKDAWRHMQFKLDVPTCKKLETLLKQRRLHSRDELIAQLIAAA